MRLDPAQSLVKVGEADRGVLATVHPDRGVDAVPVVFALVSEVAGVPGDLIGVPIDLVKPKSSTRLQRERNLERDARATLLVDHWDRDDWSRLWWVRAELRWCPEPDDQTVAALARELADRYPQYREQPFARILVFDLVAAAGWAASP